LLVSCGGGDGGGGRGRPGEIEEITEDEYEKLVDVGEWPSGDGEAGTEVEEGGRVGYELVSTLSGTGDKYTFDIYARHDQVDVVFEWPQGDVDFWVKVYGEDGEVLGDFDLDNGETIQLFHGGKFTLEIYSREGGGTWRATY